MGGAVKIEQAGPPTVTTLDKPHPPDNIPHVKWAFHAVVAPTSGGQFLDSAASTLWKPVRAQSPELDGELGKIPMQVFRHGRIDTFVAVSEAG